MFIIVVQRKNTVLYTRFGGMTKAEAKSKLTYWTRQEAEVSGGEADDGFVFVDGEIFKRLSIHKLI